MSASGVRAGVGDVKGLIKAIIDAKSLISGKWQPLKTSGGTPAQFLQSQTTSAGSGNISLSNNNQTVIGDGNNVISIADIPGLLPLNDRPGLYFKLEEIDIESQQNDKSIYSYSGFATNDYDFSVQPPTPPSFLIVPVFGLTKDTSGVVQKKLEIIGDIFSGSFNEIIDEDIVINANTEFCLAYDDDASANGTVYVYSSEKPSDPWVVDLPNPHAAITNFMAYSASNIGSNHGISIINNPIVEHSGVRNVSAGEVFDPSSFPKLRNGKAYEIHGLQSPVVIDGKQYSNGDRVWFDLDGNFKGLVFEDWYDLTIAEIDSRGYLSLVDADSRYSEKVKNNFNATRAPLPSDNASEGYSIQSRWIYNNEVYFCIDATNGSWVNTTLGIDDLGDMALRSSGSGPTEFSNNQENEQKFLPADRFSADVLYRLDNINGKAIKDAFVVNYNGSLLRLGDYVSGSTILVYDSNINSDYTEVRSAGGGRGYSSYYYLYCKVAIRLMNADQINFTPIPAGTYLEVSYPPGGGNPTIVKRSTISSTFPVDAQISTNSLNLTLGINELAADNDRDLIYKVPNISGPFTITSNQPSVRFIKTGIRAILTFDLTRAPTAYLDFDNNYFSILGNTIEDRGGVIQSGNHKMYGRFIKVAITKQVNQDAFFVERLANDDAGRIVTTSVGEVDTSLSAQELSIGDNLRTIVLDSLSTRINVKLPDIWMRFFCAILVNTRNIDREIIPNGMTIDSENDNCKNVIKANCSYLICSANEGNTYYLRQIGAKLLADTFIVSDQSITLDKTHVGKTLVFNNPLGCVVTVNDDLGKGFNVELVSEVAADISLVNGTGAVQNFSGHSKLAGQWATAKLVESSISGTYILSGETKA